MRVGGVVGQGKPPTEDETGMEGEHKCQASVCQQLQAKRHLVACLSQERFTSF